jgi:hypothetical protein
MSYREAIEMAKHGEVLRWSTESDEDESKERVLPHTFLKGSPVAKLGNVGRQRVPTTKLTRPIVKAREARKLRQDKALLPSSPPATFGADNPPEPPQAANNTTPNESNLSVDDVLAGCAASTS